MKTTFRLDTRERLLRWVVLLATLLVLQFARAAEDPTFTRMDMGTVVPSWGCAWGDYNNDGYPDLFVSEGTWTTAAACSLYRNNQDGTFTEVTPDEAGDIVGFERYWMHGAWGDFDNDGALDLFVTDNAPLVAESVLWKNLGNGSFADVTSFAVDDLFGTPIWSDCDRDGHLDLIFANAWYQPPQWDTRNALVFNRGHGAFERVTEGDWMDYRAQVQAGAVGDMDNDDDPDILLSTGTGAVLFENDGDGGFQRVTAGFPAVSGLCVTPSWADCDNDGRLDVFLARYDQTSLLLHNDGEGQWTQIPLGEPLETSCGMWADYDNDGDLDLFIARGQSRATTNLFFANNGDGTFTSIDLGDVTGDLGHSAGCAWADYDNNGFLDLLVTRHAGLQETLYRNHGNDNRWILIKLVGTASNRSAIGAKVRVQATIFGKTTWQMRELDGGNRYQSDLRAHFGLGDATLVQTVRIEWPSGIVQELWDVPAQQILTVTEPVRLIPQRVGTFQIRCWVNQSFDVQSSTDLVSWTPAGTVTNETGNLIFEGVEVDQHGCRYYRVSDARPNMVWIPPGTFLMGSPEDEEDRREDEGPQTSVTLTKGFWMGKYEVTQGEYLAVMGSNPSYFNGVRGETDYGVDLNRPVEQVSWNDAVAYCAALTERERAAGRIPMSYQYRLPTEAEWEYACRAATTTRFSYGDDPGYTDLLNYAWYVDNIGDTTQPVKHKLPNPWGLYDIHGNVWEWCQDRWADNLPGGISIDPQGPITGSDRVVRGGGWCFTTDFLHTLDVCYAWYCRSASRFSGHPRWGILIGFRVVLASVSSESTSSE